MITLLLISAAFIVLGRFTVPSHGISWPGSYEAMSHIWVGIVSAVIYYEWGTTNAWWFAGVLILTTVFETVMFFVWPKKEELP